MTKHTGLHFAYFAMRSTYAAMLIGGGRMPWNRDRWGCAAAVLPSACRRCSGCEYTHSGDGNIGALRQMCCQ